MDIVSTRRIIIFKEIEINEKNGKLLETYFVNYIGIHFFCCLFRTDRWTVKSVSSLSNRLTNSLYNQYDCYSWSQGEFDWISYHRYLNIFDGYSFSMTSSRYFFHFALNHSSILTLIDVFKYAQRQKLRVIK
jgi:hypothetical protein